MALNMVPALCLCASIRLQRVHFWLLLRGSKTLFPVLNAAWASKLTRFRSFMQQAGPHCSLLPVPISLLGRCNLETHRVSLSLLHLGLSRGPYYNFQRPAIFSSGAMQLCVAQAVEHASFPGASEMLRLVVSRLMSRTSTISSCEYK